MGTKLNILYISSLYPPYTIGGAEIIASCLAESIAEYGHKVTVLTTGDPNLLRNRRLIKQNVNKVTVIQCFPDNGYWIYNKGKPAFYKKALWHFKDAWNKHSFSIIKDIINEEKPDLIHSHNIDGFSPVVWYAAKQHGTPVIHTAHDCHLLCPRANLLKRNGALCEQPNVLCDLYRKWYRRATSKIDVFCAPSKTILTSHKQYGMKPGEYRLVRNGIPFEAGSRQDATSLISEELRILYLGRLDTHKGLAILLDAIADLPRDVPLILNIAGTGPLEEEVKFRAKSDTRIKFHGYVTGKAKNLLFQTNDLLILPTMCKENAPLTVLEAYQAGLGVLGSRIGGMPEIIVDGETGFLFSPGDSEVIIDLLNKLARNRGLLEKLRTGALAASSSYTITQMAKNYLSIYFGLMR